MAIVAMLLLQDAVIDAARTLTAGQARFGCWLPIEVVVHAPAGFNGDVAVVTPPVTVTKAVRLAAGERRAVVVPALPFDLARPITIELRAGGVVRASRRLEETVVLAEHIVIKPPEGWRELDPAYFEAVDVVEGEAWTPRARFGVVDDKIAPLRSSDPWIATKRDAAIFFVVVYAFAGFVTLVAVLRRTTRAWGAAAAVCALSLAFVVAFLVFYPRGRTAVRAWGVVAGDLEYRLHVVRGGPVTYAQLAKPVFESWQRVPPKVEVRLDRGCTLVGADAAMTVERAAAIGRTVPADDAPDVRFFSRFDGRLMRLDEQDPPLTGVSGSGLVEARLSPRLVVIRVP